MSRRPTSITDGAEEASTTAQQVAAHAELSDTWAGCPKAGEATTSRQAVSLSLSLSLPSINFLNPSLPLSAAQSCLAADEWSGAADEPFATAELPIVAGDQPCGSEEPPLGATEQPLGASDRWLRATDQPSGAVDQPFATADRRSVAGGEPLVAGGQPFGSEEQPLGAADRSSGATEGTPEAAGWTFNAEYDYLRAAFRQNRTHILFAVAACAFTLYFFDASTDRLAVQHGDNGLSLPVRRDQPGHRISTPADLPLLAVHDSRDLTERYWGTYRPGVYFGTTYRSPGAFATGLMWFEQLPPGKLQVRHECDQSDGVTRYGWLKHDGRHFGIQEIIDTRFKLRIEFLKQPRNGTAGDWTSRIKVTPTKKQIANVSLLYYVIDEKTMSEKPRFTPVLTDGKLVGLQGDTGNTDAGETAALGKRFRIDFNDAGIGQVTHDHLITHLTGRQLLEDSVTASLKYNKGDKHHALKAGHARSNTPGPNTYVYQLTGVLPLSLEVSFRSGVEAGGLQSDSAPPTTSDFGTFDAEVARHSKAFDDKFETTFGLAGRGYPPKEIDAARAALSCLLGSIGYFSGTSLVQSKDASEPTETWPAELYTAMPSRSSHPSGSLWDEGFHNALISRWDESISRDIIGHWINLANVDGWIPRQHQLGEDGVLAPEKLDGQRDDIASPPTLFLPLKSIVQRIASSAKHAGGAVSESDARFLDELFPRLRLWYRWINSSQAGSEFSTYRWRGRNASASRELNPRTLASGLVDYPRASHPSDGERHVDLRCWMALATDVMADVARTTGQPSDVLSEFDATRSALFDNDLLDRLHWSASSRGYADFGLHTDAVRLQESQPPPPDAHRQPGQPAPPRESVLKVMAEPTYQLVESHYGYVSLFPLLLRVLDARSERLGAMLEELRREDLLWTKYGLRSLAKSSLMYKRHNSEREPPLWRGSVRINMNYLAASALHHYASTEGPYRERARQLHQELRTNVVKNVIQQYVRTGYVWEWYDDETGRGVGSHPFDSGSSLFVLMMAEMY